MLKWADKQTVVWVIALKQAVKEDCYGLEMPYLQYMQIATRCLTTWGKGWGSRHGDKGMFHHKTA